jgi:hypothetical protein
MVMKKQSMYSVFYNDEYRENFNENYELMLDDIENGKFNLNISDYVQHYESILDDDLCDQIVDGINKNPNILKFSDKLSNLLRTGTFVNTFVPYDEFNQNIEKIIKDVISKVSQKYTADVRPLYYSYGNKFNHFSYHVLKYGPEDYFKVHHDHYAETLNYSRLFTISLYLNEEYDGGELTFPSVGKKYRPKKGDAIVFPSNWMFYHGVEKITSGNRYSIIVWVGIDLEDCFIDFFGK